MRASKGMESFSKLFLEAIAKIKLITTVQNK